MELKHATIKQIIPKGKDIEVQFNPTEYRLSRSNQYAEVAVPGLPAPLIQFGRGNADTLSMQLFFDTYTAKDNKDVRIHTQKVVNLLNINPELHAPPVCRFIWGELDFTCVLERAEQRFTLFMPNGVPVRATVDVTFKQHLEGEKHVSKNKSANFTRRYVVQRGDTLSHIAYEVYGDPALWRPIAEANDFDDPLALDPGQPLVIPAIE